MPTSITRKVNFVLLVMMILSIAANFFLLLRVEHLYDVQRILVEMIKEQNFEIEALKTACEDTSF